MDFWSEAKDKDGKPRHGQIVVREGRRAEQHAKNHASVETHNEWLTPDGVKIIDEVRVIHFIDTQEGRLFAFDITLKASVCPISVRRHEGGLVRHPRPRRAAAEPEERARP